MKYAVLLVNNLARLWESVMANSEKRDNQVETRDKNRSLALFQATRTASLKRNGKILQPNHPRRKKLPLYLL
jgi:hypothetical protein